MLSAAERRRKAARSDRSASAPRGDAKSLQISIRHPNNSGFQIDPRTGDAIPPHFVSHIRLSAGGETLMEADTGISLSENPTLRIASSRVRSRPR